MPLFIRSCFISCLVCFQVFTPALHSQNIDIDILKSINPQHPVVGFWKATSDSYVFVSGAVALGTLTYALIKDDRDQRYKSYELIIAIGINVLTTDAMKVIFNRQRPADRYPDDINVITPSHGQSFPSGHTSLAFATATSLTLTYRKWYITMPAYAWAGCMGFSRMYLGKHYPTDVLAGAVVGAGSGVLSHWLTKKLFREKQVAASHSNSL